MHCPICIESLSETDTGNLCPKGHGVLLTSKQLRDIENLTLSSAGDQSDAMLRAPSINCPQCGQSMEVVNYNSTGILIDACTICHIRWLDSKEAHKIQTLKQKISSNDGDYLAKIDSQLHAQGVSSMPPAQIASTQNAYDIRTLSQELGVEDQPSQVGGVIRSSRSRTVAFVAGIICIILLYIVYKYSVNYFGKI